MGRVYLGQSRTGRRLAIKMLSEQFAEDPEYRERFAREVAAAKLVSPLYTAAVVDADPQAKNPWLATTFIEGPSLEERVTQHGVLPPEKVLALAAGLAEALISIHTVGLVHRDLKPSNVIINSNGPHIIDFGIALASADTRITTSLMVGTPSYMAPERVNGIDAGPAGDIFSLGATLFYAATASQLVSGGSFYEQIIQVAMGQFDLTAVPEDCRPIIDLCLSQAPQDRPSADELMRVLIGMGVQQPEAGWWPELEARSSQAELERPSRRRILIGASAFGVLLAGGGVSAIAYRLRPRATPDARSGAEIPSPSPAEPIPSPEKGRVMWWLASGAGAKPGIPDSSAVRVIVHRDSHIITTAGSAVFATRLDESRAWTQNLSASSLRLWPWGDAVLAADMRKVWMFDTQSGEKRFEIDLAGMEESRYPDDNRDRMTVQIDRIVLGTDRALVGLGTATVAIDRAGQRAWRVKRPVGENGLRTPPPMTVVVGGDIVVSRESGNSPRLTGRRPGNGAMAWSQPDTFRGAGGQPPPPGGGGPGGDMDESWQRIEGRVSGDLIALRVGQEIQVRSAGNGRLLWYYTSQTPVTGVEIVGGLVLTTADRLIAWDAMTGRFAWDRATRGARVAVVGDSLVVMHDDGLTMLTVDGGQLVWNEPFPTHVRETRLDRLTVHERTAHATFRPKGGPGPGGPGNPGLPPGARPPVDVVAFRLG